MPNQGSILYKNRGQITNDLIDAWLARIPDARIDADSVARLLFEVIGQEISGNYLAAELLYQDIWPQTADTLSLLRFGEEFNYPIESGTKAGGSLRIAGAGGTYIPAGSQFVAIVSASEPYLFNTTESGTIPEPGIPDAPIVADAAVAGNLTGTFEYGITFLTLAGETVMGQLSSALVLAASKTSLTVIPLGGPGTVGRSIYRQKDGGVFKLVTTIADNSTTVYTDNIADGSLGGAPLEVSTAERLTLSAEATEVGVKYNVAAQTITSISEAPDGINAVTNISAFTGGSDPQDYEDYRRKLLAFIADPQSGSPADLKLWIEEVDGIEEATVFVNDDLGTPTNGHNTIRISGPGAIIPDAGVIAAGQARLDLQDLANITNHVTTFTPNVINTEVEITVDSSFSLDDVQPSVEEAVANYINFVPVGDTVYVSGIVDAVFGLAGVVNVIVTLPTADVTSSSTEKAQAGTISVTEI